MSTKFHVSARPRRPSTFKTHQLPLSPINTNAVQGDNQKLLDSLDSFLSHVNEHVEAAAAAIVCCAPATESAGDGTSVAGPAPETHGWLKVLCVHPLLCNLQNSCFVFCDVCICYMHVYSQHSCTLKFAAVCAPEQRQYCWPTVLGISVTCHLEQILI